ncbi:MAG: circadian clock KaiB family protein [Anaerolineae bacterium]|nr:circadian clock KaiB family protein [Anaerolineae bacterium]MBN8620120.1 circadian clock KaiB family protein [Anaerolineae bacterium]
MSLLSLKLYVSRRTLKTEQAIANLEKLFNEQLKGKYELTVIDVRENPEQAEADKVLATPTLIHDSSDVRRRIIGDMSDTSRILNAILNDETGGDR